MNMINWLIIWRQFRIRCHNIIWPIYCYSLEKAWYWKNMHCLENIWATATLLKNVVVSAVSSFVTFRLHPTIDIIMYSGPNLLSGHFYWLFILTWFSPLEGMLTMMVYGRCWSLWCLKCVCGCLLGGRFSNHGVQLWQAPWVLRKRTVTLTQKTSHLFSPKHHFRQPTVKDWTRGGKYLLHTLDLCFLVQNNKETWNIQTWRIQMKWIQQSEKAVVDG